jgi:hypothetical protein
MGVWVNVHECMGLRHIYVYRGCEVCKWWMGAPVHVEVRVVRGTCDVGHGCVCRVHVA